MQVCRRGVLWQMRERAFRGRDLGESEATRGEEGEKQRTAAAGIGEVLEEVGDGVRKAAGGDGCGKMLDGEVAVFGLRPSRLRDKGGDSWGRQLRKLSLPLRRQFACRDHRPHAEHDQIEQYLFGYGPGRNGLGGDEIRGDPGYHEFAHHVLVRRRSRVGSVRVCGRQMCAPGFVIAAGPLEVDHDPGNPSSQLREVERLRPRPAAGTPAGDRRPALAVMIAAPILNTDVQVVHGPNLNQVLDVTAVHLELGRWRIGFESPIVTHRRLRGSVVGKVKVPPHPQAHR